MQVINNRSAAAYLQLGVWVPSARLRQVFLNGVTAGLGAMYIDRFDRVVSRVTSQDQTSPKPALWDPNLIDSTSGAVGPFDSVIGNATSNAWVLGAYDPSTTDQRIYQTASLGPFQELNIADLSSAPIDTDAFVKITRAGSNDFDIGGAGDVGAWAGEFNAKSNFVFFEDIDLGIVMNARVILVSPTVKSNVIVAIDLTDGSGAPLGVPGDYSASANEFGRPAVFDEPDIKFVGIQFLADDQSTKDKPKGELMMFSRITAPLTPDDGRVYIKFVDFNPSSVAGTPNRIHLRETFFSRINLTLNSVPTGDPPSPLNGLPSAVAELQMPNVWFTTEGQRLINVMATDGHTAGFGNTHIVQANKSVVAQIVTAPAPKSEPRTNTTVGYRSEVLGDLGEKVSNVVVDWTALRQSTVSEILLTTPTPGETVTVANVPIDRGILFDPGFAVLEDGVPLVEGGGNDYTVNEALGEITFLSPKPLAGGEVYTIRYAHTAAPASPSHGTIVDSQVFSDVNGVAETRITFPDTAALVGHIDEIKATTA